MLAIVIPYYKLTFFEETLESLSNQTDKRFKAYIGDDASAENPSDLLEKYKGKFDFVYHRFESNLGGISLVEQWERCITLSGKEEWIMVLGDDDYLGETVVELWYEKYADFYKKTNLVRFASKLIFEESKSVSDLFVHPLWENATDSFFRKFERISRSSLSEHIFSKESYRKYGFYDYPLAWNSDDRAWLDFSENKPIFTINESVVFVRMSSLNISGNLDNFAVKNLSVIAFFKYLILDKLKFYDRKKQIMLLVRYENAIKNTRPLKNSDWFFLFFYYVKYFDLDGSKKFVKRFLIILLKNINTKRFS